MMITFLAPAMSQLLEAAELAVQGDPSQLSQTLGPALQLVQESIKMAEVTAPGLPQTPEMEELLRQVHLEQQAQLDAIGFLSSGQAGKTQLARHVTSLRSASERLPQLIRDIEAAEAREMRLAPFPYIDNLLRVGANLMNNRAKPADLALRLDIIAPMAAGMLRDLESFAALYNSAELAAEARDHLRTAGEAIAAGRTYLETLDLTTLRECLSGLSQASHELYQTMRRVDEVVMMEVRYHHLRPLEDLGRASKLEASPALLNAVWASVDRALGAVAQRVDILRRDPISFELETQLSDTNAALEGVTTVTESIDRSSIPADVVERLAPLWDKLERSYRDLEDEYGRLGRAFAHAPNLGVLRELIGRTLRGEFTAAQFMTRLETLHQQHEIMLKSLEAAPADPLLEELAQLGRTHSMAHARMRLYSEDSDPDHLRQSWKLIALTTGRLVEIAKEMRAKMGAKPPASASSGVICFRCGAPSARGSKFCSSCKCVLPPSTVEVVDYQDISPVASAPTAVATQAPAHLVKLEHTAQQYQAGKLDLENLQKEVEDQLRNCERTRQSFEQQKSNPSFGRYGGAFLEQLDRYWKGLETMRGGENVGAGLRECLAAGQELQALQSQLRRASQ